MSQDNEQEKQAGKQGEEETADKKWIGVGMAIGAAFGLLLGLFFENLAIGLPLGISFGLIFGTSLQKRKDAEQAE